MNDIEVEVRKKVVAFCTYLELHVERWRLALEESTKITTALCNQSEQLQLIQDVNLSHTMERFHENHDYYQFSISSGIEEDIQAIKQIMERLNKANQELINKLSTLEKLTLKLDWGKQNNLINGSPIQPPLSRILSDGLDFWLFFKKSLQHINERFKSIDIREKQSMEDFREAFNVDLTDKVVMYFIAITQYINNSTAVV